MRAFLFGVKILTSLSFAVVMIEKVVAIIRKYYNYFVNKTPLGTKYATVY